jgi:predicted DNA repair protein MutK
MVTKPRPKPLSVTRALIEKEKLEVLKRTERRIAEIGAVAKAQTPQSSRLFTLTFIVLVLLLYTAFSFATKCQCTCTI